MSEQSSGGIAQIVVDRPWFVALAAFATSGLLWPDYGIKSIFLGCTGAVVLVSYSYRRVGADTTSTEPEQGGERR